MSLPATAENLNNCCIFKLRQSQTTDTWNNAYKRAILNESEGFAQHETLTLLQTINVKKQTLGGENAWVLYENKLNYEKNYH